MFSEGAMRPQQAKRECRGDFSMKQEGIQKEKKESLGRVGQLTMRPEAFQSLQKKPYKARTASRDRLQGNNGSAQDESSNLRSAKSRTASKERLKENESAINQQAKSAAAQSRTSSSKDGRISQHDLAGKTRGNALIRFSFALAFPVRTRAPMQSETQSGKHPRTCLP